MKSEHRTGLLLTEQVGVVAQLAAFGIGAAQIAKRTKLARVRVDAALTVAGSEVARAAVVDQDLDLTEAAVVAEFFSDPEAVDQLVKVAGSGRIDHVAQRLRDDRTRTARREAFTAALTADGVRVADEGEGVLLQDLTDQAGVILTVEGHAGCARTAARVKRAWGRVDRATGLLPAGTTPDTDEEDGDEDKDEPVDDGTAWAEYPTAAWVCLAPDAHGHLRRKSA